MSPSNKQPKQTKQGRRHFTPEQKAQVLHRHLIDKVPISQLCDELKLQPSVFYYWQTQLFEHVRVALSVPKPAASREHQLQEKIAVLEAKCRRCGWRTGTGRGWIRRRAVA